MVASVDPASSDGGTEGADALLGCCLRRHDLLLRIDSTQWLVAIPEGDTEITEFERRIHNEVADTNRNYVHAAIPKISIRRCGTWPLILGAPQITESILKIAAATESPTAHETETLVVMP